MASEERNNRNKLIGEINRLYNEKKRQAKDQFAEKKDNAFDRLTELEKRKERAPRSRKFDIEQEQVSLEQDLVAMNREESSLMRMLELERRDRIAKIGTSYVPAFDGIVQAVYRGIDASGNHYASYGGKAYKAIAMGATSIRKGTLVQLWFSGNSYYIDW